MTNTMQHVEPPLITPERIQRRRRKAFGRKFAFWFAFILVVGISAFLGYARVAWEAGPLQAFTLLSAGGDIAWNKIRPTPPFGGRTHVNILMLGADVAFDGSGAARTDTIKYISVDLQKPSISIMSIPRDTWVDIPGHRPGRINGAYQYGGAKEADRLALAKETVINLLSELSGREITIDHYVRIQTGGFMHIVDAMGGVEIDVEKRMKYSDPSQKLFIDLQPGPQRLNGEQAMGYVRFRMDAEGDYGRIRRQDQFIRALAAQLAKPEEKARLPRLVGPIMSMLVTDIDQSDLLALKRIVDTLGMEGIHLAQLPTVPTRKGRAQVVEVEDTEAARLAICEVLDGPRPTVLVLNATGQGGLAREVRDGLDATAYNVVGLGTVAAPVPVSQIITCPRCKGDASELATRLGVQDVSTEAAAPEAEFDTKIPPPPAEITIVLGEDFTGLPEGTAQAELPE